MDSTDTGYSNLDFEKRKTGLGITFKKKRLVFKDAGVDFTSREGT